MTSLAPRLSPRTGTYALWLRLDQPQHLTVGRLGSLSFAAGTHVYVGSAFGPGGLRARLSRHIRKEKRLHWHIDYLLGTAQLREIWQAPGETRWECRWAQIIARFPDSHAPSGTLVEIPAHGFGASDCDCGTHLFYIPVEVDLDGLRDALRHALPSEGGIEILRISEPD